MCYDLFFKAVFIGQENILAKMVADITGIDYEILKDNVTLETTELPISTKNEKAKRCDFVLRVRKDNIINLELNLHSYAGLIVKNLSYLFWLFSTSFKRGEKYNENLIVTQININCFKDTFASNTKPLSKYHLREDDTNELYLENVGIYNLNVVNCSKVYYNVDNKEDLPNYIRWGALIYCNNINDIPNITEGILSSKEREMIMDKLDNLTRDDLFMPEKEALEWEEWERNSILDEMAKNITKEVEEKVTKEVSEKVTKEVTKKVREKALKEGIEQNIKQTIQNMLKKKMAIEDIADVTGKSINEIKKYMN